MHSSKTKYLSHQHKIYVSQINNPKKKKTKNKYKQGSHRENLQCNFSRSEFHSLFLLPQKYININILYETFEKKKCSVEIFEHSRYEKILKYIYNKLKQSKTVNVKQTITVIY